MELIIIPILILLLLIPLSMLWPTDSPWAPWWKTSNEKAILMAQFAGVGPSDVIYELGSGDAKPLIAIVKKFKCRGVGIEIDPLRFWHSKLIAFKSPQRKKIKLIRGNLFKQDLSNASVVFVYLIPKALDKLLPKLKKELKTGTRIVSNNYDLDLPIRHYDRKNKIYLYVI